MGCLRFRCSNIADVLVWYAISIWQIAQITTSLRLELNLKYSHTFDDLVRAVFLFGGLFVGLCWKLCEEVGVSSSIFYVLFSNARVTSCVEASTQKYDVDVILTSTRRRHRRVAPALIKGFRRIFVSICWLHHCERRGKILGSLMSDTWGQTCVVTHVHWTCTAQSISVSLSLSLCASLSLSQRVAFCSYFN